jgi:hypothetical protein
MALFRRRRSRSKSLLLVGAGALAGLALGALIAERSGGIAALLGSGGNGRGSGNGRRWRSPDGQDEDSSEYRPDEDADSELAPEAISHMHVRGRRSDAEETLELDELEALEERVLEAFRNDLILCERAIDIGAVDSGTIELTGWVRAASEIGHALTLARGVPGIDVVVDRLAVRGAEPRRDHSTSNYSDTRVFGGPDATLRAD